MSLELIDRKVGSSFPRHQQHQQLGSEGAQGLAVDQLDLFARLHVGNLGEQEAQGFPARERHTGHSHPVQLLSSGLGRPTEGKPLLPPPTQKRGPEFVFSCCETPEWELPSPFPLVHDQSQPSSPALSRALLPLPHGRR